MGTPGYMAVEQYERADEVTHLADVYSLAVMSWRIVTGRPPWPPSDPAVLRHLQRTQVPERPSTDIMPAKWADLLLAAMSVDPSARPQSVRELATALASALPAIGRLPSGAEILASMAPHFVRKAAPNVETVRNASDVDRIGPLLWSPGTAREAPPRLPTIEERSAVDLDEATIKDRSDAERQAPPAAPFEPTINERSASDLEATIKERSAIDLEATIEERSAAARNVPPAASLEPTIKERNAVDRDEAILNERSAAERHVPTAAPFEPTVKFLWEIVRGFSRDFVSAFVLMSLVAF
jgi:serine/threonine protein kinase